MTTHLQTHALPFQDFPDHTRVWIYQTGQSLAGLETHIETHLTPFLANWQSHGMPVKGSYAVYLDACLLIVGLEAQEGVSGCSTDGLVRTIQRLATETGQDFFNRTACTLIGPSGIEFVPLSSVKKGLLTHSAEEYSYLDITQNKLGDLRRKWPTPLLKSWIPIKTEVIL